MLYGSGSSTTTRLAAGEEGNVTSVELASLVISTIHRYDGRLSGPLYHWQCSRWVQQPLCLRRSTGSSRWSGWNELENGPLSFLTRQQSQQHQCRGGLYHILWGTCSWSWMKSYCVKCEGTGIVAQWALSTFSLSDPLAEWPNTPQGSVSGAVTSPWVMELPVVDQLDQGRKVLQSLDLVSAKLVACHPVTCHGAFSPRHISAVWERTQLQEDLGMMHFPPVSSKLPLATNKTATHPGALIPPPLPRVGPLFLHVLKVFGDKLRLYQKKVVPICLKKKIHIAGTACIVRVP